MKSYYEIEARRLIDEVNNKPPENMGVLTC